MSLAVRAAVFGVLWIILGKRIWFFPNILAEEATLSELFRFWPKKDEEEPPKWTSRLFYAMLSAVVILLLRHHAPDEAARSRWVLFIFSCFLHITLRHLHLTFVTFHVIFVGVCNIVNWCSLYKCCEPDWRS